MRTLNGSLFQMDQKQRIILACLKYTSYLLNAMLVVALLGFLGWFAYGIYLSINS